MSVTVMDKLTVLLPAADTEQLLRGLAQLSCAELISTLQADEQGVPLPPLSCNAREAAEAAARIDRLLPILTAHVPHRRRHRIAPIPVDAEEFTRTGARERTLKAAEEAERLLAAMEQAQAALATEEAEMNALLPYLSFPFSLDDEGTKSATLLLGSLPAGTAESTLQEIAVATGFVCEILTADKAGVYIAVVAHRAMLSEVREALDTLSFTPAALRHTNGTATAVFDAAGARAKALREELHHTETQLSALSENLSNMRILSDLLHVEAQLESYKQKMAALGSCAVLTAWYPTHERERVVALLESMDAAYEITPPTEGERPPVSASNPPYRGKLSPWFGTYTYPELIGKYTAPLLSVLYLLAFGLLFADVGYGLLTALLFFGAARFLATEERTVRAFLMLGAGGLFMIPFGILVGNYFGPWLATALGLDTPHALALIPAARDLLYTHLHPLAAPRGFLLLAIIPAALLWLLKWGLRLRAAVQAHSIPQELCGTLPTLVLFTGLGLLPFFPIIGISLFGVGLLASLLLSALTQHEAQGRLIYMGGALCKLLTSLAEALQTARVLLLGLALSPVALLINLLPLERGEVIVWYFGMLLTFLLSHLLGLALDRATVATRRIRLCYMARFEPYYEGHDTLLSPLRITRRYTAELPHHEAAQEAVTEESAQNAEHNADATVTKL